MAVPAAGAAIAGGSAAGASTGAATAAGAAAVAGGFGIFGNIIAGEYNKKANEKYLAEQAKLQKEFAQNSIQWKMQDAAKAGINPYYAIGAPSMSYQPMQDFNSEDSLGQGIQNLGATINESILSYQTQKLQNKLLQKQIESQDLENKAKELAIGQEAGLFNISPVYDSLGRRYAGLTQRGKFVEERLGEADGLLGFYNQLKASSASYDYVKSQLRPGEYVGFDMKTSMAYATQNAKDRGLPPVINSTEIMKFESMAKMLLNSGAKTLDVIDAIAKYIASFGGRSEKGVIDTMVNSLIK